MTEGTRQLADTFFPEEIDQEIPREFPSCGVQIVEKFRCDVNTTCPNCLNHPIETAHALVGNHNPKSIMQMCSGLFAILEKEGFYKRD